MTDIDVGRFGIWRRWQETSPEFAREAEALGYGAIWLGSSPGADLDVAERLLAATDRIVIATGIVNMWATSADDVAASYRRITDAHPGRFLLGVGIGHPEATREYQSPYDTIVAYLDRLDAGGVPVDGRVLAALGPKVLRLAAERARGAHPYLVTPEHSRRAREILGPDALLAPEQKVVLDEDADRARTTARGKVAHPYLKLSNYTNNLRRLGWTDEDIAGDGSDALIDELAPHGDAATVAAAVTRHLEVGANHVALQPLTADDADPLPTLRALAQALKLT
ncbi:LLM class F420-dependent oxidoreductase [Actinomadura rayongensis]|uniref:TIGR03620 family F420-dependent LLM class oxidoreductase n=1 Tax=Actinomadura rayongensis TaxID=1429076 RepID=A0A6I4WGP2_9ACTN|nr:LLM class F420-dependent oxidoreductase [Actinomadura rayongensis]MXQ68083.1 TIGR03620 family F420-dependent LLM class oxidoreductase [Actinomadura rayongensis]